METDRLLSPSKDIQKSVESLWTMVRRAGDILAERQDVEAQVQTRIAYLESEIESKNAALETQAATMAHWKEEIATIDELRATMKALYEKLNDMQSELSQREEQLQHLSDAARAHSEQQEQNQALSAELNHLRSEAQSWQVRAQNLEQTLQERGHQLSEAQELEQRIKEEREQERAQHQYQLDEVNRLRLELEQLQIHVQRQHDASSEYKSQLEEMTARMYETEKQLILTEEKVKYFEGLQSTPSDTPTLIEGMLRDELERAKERILELEKSPSLHEMASAIRSRSETLSSVQVQNNDAAQGETLQAIRNKLQSVIDILEHAGE